MKRATVIFFFVGLVCLYYYFKSDNYIQHSYYEMIVKRNNPGNLRNYYTNHWVGSNWNEIPEGQFLTFETLTYGYRAMLMDLNNDVGEGTDTIHKLIMEYAPASENPTQAYIDYVSEATGISEYQHINHNDWITLGKIALYMSLFEHGLVNTDIEKKNELFTQVNFAINLLIT